MLTFASAFMGALIITGVAVLSLERHGWYVAGWLTATAVAFAVLGVMPRLVGVDVHSVVVTALFAGPLAGAAVHLVALRLR